MIRPVLSAFNRIGANPADDAELRFSKTLGKVCVLLGFFLSMLLCSVYVNFGEMLAGWLWCAYGLYLVVGLALFHMRRISYSVWGYWSIPTLLIPSFANTILLGGLTHSSGVMVWGLLVPMLNLILLEPRHTLYWAGVYLTLLAVSAGSELYLPQTTDLPAGLVTFLFIFHLGGISSFVIIVFYYFVNQRNLFQEQSEALLLNVLPKEIAEVLKTKNGTIADYHTNASVLFADVVNFTPLSAQMSPTELVELLNAVFSYFDALAEKHSVEKIKTIGDCYMVAAGVPRSRSDHAKVLATMALEMRDYVAQHEFYGKNLSFRIGINSGPVVAGVIGRKKFIYDLWGDAVNTASRMESHGTGGKIQITRATYELLNGEFVCEPHGMVTVKGKGEMETWFLVGKKA